MKMEHFSWIKITLKIFLWIMWFSNIKGDHSKTVKNRPANVSELSSKSSKRLENS